MQHTYTGVFDLSRGYNQVVNNEYYTRFTNPFLDFNSNNIDSECKQIGKNSGQFAKKNVLPINHWRKEKINGKDCPTNQIIFKDNLALSKEKSCNIYCKKAKKNNPNYIFSHSTLNERRNRTYNQNLKLITKQNIHNKNQFVTPIHPNNETIVKYSNPTFRKTGAVSSRNRISALKNGNNNKYTRSNMYNKRCDNIFAYNKIKDAPKTKVLCRPPNYRGGQHKKSLMRCNPKEILKKEETPVLQIDITAPIITKVSDVPSVSYNTTAVYTFHSTETGSIITNIAGFSQEAIAGDNEITFNTLSPGTYNNITIKVIDEAGNESNILKVNEFAIIPDAIPPELTMVINVPKYLQEARIIECAFYSSEAGRIYISNATAAKKYAVAKPLLNTLILDPLPIGTYNNITIKVIDEAGNESNILNVNEFTIIPDVTPPVLTLVSDVPILSTNTRPQYKFHSTEAGTIIIENASSETTQAIIGNNIINFNPLSYGTYDNIRIKVIDLVGNESNILTVNKFTIRTEIIPPVITTVTIVPALLSINTPPQYTFHSTEAGRIASNANFSSTTDAVVGNNTITFNGLSLGQHNNITIKVIDDVGNESNVLRVNDFTIRTEIVPPIITKVANVPTPSINTNPQYTFHSDETGTIDISNVISNTTEAIIGNNIITFNNLSRGTYNNITIKVTDDAGNDSNILQVNDFEIHSYDISSIDLSGIDTYINSDDANKDHSLNIIMINHDSSGQLLELDINGITNYSGTIKEDKVTINLPSQLFKTDLSDNHIVGGRKYDISASVSDAYGNKSEVKSINFILDKTAPDISNIDLSGVDTYININNSLNDYSLNIIMTNTDASGQILKLDISGIKDYSGIVNGDKVTINLPSQLFKTDLSDNHTVGGHKYDISASVSDAAGNESEVKSTNFILDRTAPVINKIDLLGVNDGGYLKLSQQDISNDIIVTMTNADASGQKLILEMNGVDYSGIIEVSRVTIEIPRQTFIDMSDNNIVGGLKYDISASVSDAAGNESEVKSISFFMDKTSPIISEISGVTTPSTNTEPQYTFNSNEAGTIDISNATSATTNIIDGSNTIIFNTLPVGEHSNIEIRVIDSAGNKSNILDVNNFNIFSYDISSIDLSGIDSYINIADANKDYSLNIIMKTNDASGQQLKLDINGITDYSGIIDVSNVSITIPSKLFTDLSDNHIVGGRKYDISASVSDTSGNKSEVKSISFTLDKTKPVIELIELGFGTHLNITEGDVSQNITVTMTNDDASGQILTIDLSGADYSGIVEASKVTIQIPRVDIKDLSDGNIVGGLQYDISASVSDAAGNPAVVKNISFIVDKTRPDISSIDMSGVADGAYLRVAQRDMSHNIIIKMTNDDASGQILELELSGVKYTGIVDVSQVTIEIPKQIFNDLSDNNIPGGREYDISASVSDAAGNESEVKSISFFMDKTSPIISEISGVTTPSETTTPQYTFYSNEVGIIDISNASSSTTNAIAGNNTITFNALSIGTYNNIIIKVVDNAGNESIPLTVSSFEIVEEGPPPPPPED